jgi:electron transfer flavoprotein beta subunit
VGLAEEEPVDIVVPIKQVPDLVEELEINADGTDLEREYLTYVMNEFDEQALEEAVLLKEAHGGSVTVVGLDMGEADNVLYTAAAKGADRLVKVTGEFSDRPPDSHATAAIVAAVLDGRPCDLVLTGVQAADDLDGQIAPLLASRLGVPHVSVVSGVEADPGASVVRVKQEYGGGMIGEMEVPLPCVLGIQAAAQAPRYAPVAKVRQAMKEVSIEEVEAPSVETAGATVRRVSKPEAASHAEMISGSTEEVVDRVLAILRERGFVKA